LHSASGVGEKERENRRGEKRKKGLILKRCKKSDIREEKRKAHGLFVQWGR